MLFIRIPPHSSFGKACAGAFKSVYGDFEANGANNPLTRWQYYAGGIRSL